MLTVYDFKFLYMDFIKKFIKKKNAFVSKILLGNKFKPLLLSSILSVLYKVLH